MKAIAFLLATTAAASVLLTSCASNPALRQAGVMKDPVTGRLTRAPGTEPTAAQKHQFENMNYGMFIHFGINTFVNQEWTDGSVPAATYAPKEIAADEWVLAAKHAGMSHVVLVCKHHDGFCNWPTKFTDYSVANSGNKTDVVRAVAEACRKYGVHFAVYYSCWDRHWDKLHEADYKTDRDATDKAYTDYMVAQISELMENYGPVTELWIDGSWQKKDEAWGFDRVYDAVKRRQPLCQMAVNWTIGLPQKLNTKVFPEVQKEGYPIRYFPSDFRLADPFLPGPNDPKVFTHDGNKYYLPFESTLCLNNEWFWHADDHGLKSVDELEKIYRRATAQNNLLLLNSPPGPDGHMRPENIQRLAELRARLGQTTSSQ